MKHHFSMTDSESEQQFQRVSKQLLVQNVEQGVNYWAGSPYPTMLLWAGRIFDFLSVLEQVVGYYPARRQSYLVGYKSGWDGAEVSAGFDKDLPEPEAKVRLLSAGVEILAGAGWGRCSIDYDDGQGKVTWTFSAGTAIGLAAHLEGPRDKPACPFISGFAAGWTNRSLGTEMEFDERACVARGDPHCTFESAAFLRTRAEDVQP